MRQTFSVQLGAFMDALGMSEEPMGLMYTDRRPARGFTPRAQTPISQLAEQRAGQKDKAGEATMDWVSCMLGKLRRARRKKAPAYFDQEHYGCQGAAFFMGFKPWYEPFEPALVSTGIPGKFPGERYADSPETGKRFYDNFEPPAASGPVLIIQPLSLFREHEQPELVIMFPDFHPLIGLNALTVFLTGDMHAVRMPFGVGCCTVVSWPRKFLARGETCAVVGGYDINMIKYLKHGQLTYTVPYALFQSMVEKWPMAMPGTKAWKRLAPKRTKEAREGGPKRAG